MRDQLSMKIGVRVDLQDRPPPLLRGLVAVRYLLLAIGLGVLFVEIAQTLFMERVGFFTGGVAIALVLMLVPLMLLVVKAENQVRRQQEQYRHSMESHDYTLKSYPTYGLLGHRATRYFILGMGASVMLWQAAQGFWFGGGDPLVGAIGIGLVAVLAPAMLWTTHKEKCLHQALVHRDQQLEQRSREIMALNRMFQAHLATQFQNAPAGQHPSSQPADDGLQNDHTTIEVQRRSVSVPGFDGPILPEVVEWSFGRQDVTEPLAESQGGRERTRTSASGRVSGK